MLVLAGVSINAIIGDNGVITNAQNANFMSGMAAFEEWLQEEFVGYAEEVMGDDVNKPLFLNSKMEEQLLLKDGLNFYIRNGTDIYYLINKNCSYIPKELRDGLKKGNSADSYAKYTRFEDVYGITRDLKVYYCDNGVSNGVIGDISGDILNLDSPIVGINNNTGLKNALSEVIASQYGGTVGDKGITLANTALFNKPLELDGNVYTGIADLSGIGELKNLTELTLSNLTLTSLNGIEGIPNLNYLYLNNTTVGDKTVVGDFSALSNAINLKKLYIFLPGHIIDEEMANKQVQYLGDGLKNASGLTKLEYLGICGNSDFFPNNKSMYFDNPTTFNGYAATNLGTFTSSNKSNLSDLGNASQKTGFYAFNQTIKGNLKYLFLNNNNISDVYVLKDFTNLQAVHLMCNSSLVDVGGLENHSKLETLTLHNCALSGIGNYDTEQDKYFGGITGCTALTQLSLQANSGLESLVGIEQSNNLVYVIAHNCDLTDISSLKGKSGIVYLNLSNNVNLKNVKYIQYCKALNYLYLDGNLKMDSTELDNALNGTDENLGKTILITQCINGYANIPSNYWDLFTATSNILDFSSAKVGILTVNSPKWIKLRGRNDVIKLNLEGQTSIPMDDTVIDGTTYYGIRSTLKTLTNMRALKLRNMSQLTSISFVESKYSTDGKNTLLSGMPRLDEIDLRLTNSNLKDLSELNSCTNLRRLIFDNRLTDMSKIQITVNELGLNGGDPAHTHPYGESWVTSGNNNSAYAFDGLIYCGNEALSFANCTSITSYYSNNRMLGDEFNGIYDLSGTSVRELRIGGTKGTKTYILPSTIRKYYEYYGSGQILKFDENNPTNRPEKMEECKINNSSSVHSFKNLEIFAGIPIDVIWFDDSYEKDSSKPFTTLAAVIKIITGASTVDLSPLSTNTSLTNLDIEFRTPGTLSNLSSLGLNRSIKTLTLTNTSLTDANVFTNMTQLEYLNLYNNNLSDISGLSNLQSLTVLNLGNNSITDLTPLVTAIGSDNKIGYDWIDLRNNNLGGDYAETNVNALLKLKKAGLKRITITGINFSGNDIDYLTDGKTIDGVKYTGFGAGNITK